MSEFGQSLASIRVYRGLTQAQLGELSGIPKNSISRYENGETTPGIDMARRLADALDCSLDMLSGRVPLVP